MSVRLAGLDSKGIANFSYFPKPADFPVGVGRWKPGASLYHVQSTPKKIGVHRMNKSELIDAIAADSGLSKADAGRALDGFTSAITNALKGGDSVSMVGFGTFSVKRRDARKGRNPRTGETIKIKASNNPSFKAGKALKDAVN
jgi:DNA-binding protein HU-beta